MKLLLLNGRKRRNNRIRYNHMFHFDYNQNNDIHNNFQMKLLNPQFQYIPDNNSHHSNIHHHLDHLTKRGFQPQKHARRMHGNCIHMLLHREK